MDVYGTTSQNVCTCNGSLMNLKLKLMLLVISDSARRMRPQQQDCTRMEEQKLCDRAQKMLLHL